MLFWTTFACGGVSNHQCIYNLPLTHDGRIRASNTRTQCFFSLSCSWELHLWSETFHFFLLWTRLFYMTKYFLCIFLTVFSCTSEFAILCEGTLISDVSLLSLEVDEDIGAYDKGVNCPSTSKVAYVTAWSFIQLKNKIYEIRMKFHFLIASARRPSICEMWIYFNSSIYEISCLFNKVLKIYWMILEVTLVT